MALPTLTWFVIGAFLVYVVAVDANVYEWLLLQTRRLEIEIKRRWFMFQHNPDFFWVRYRITRNSEKLAREIMKEYENK